MTPIHLDVCVGLGVWMIIVMVLTITIRRSGLKRQAKKESPKCEQQPNDELIWKNWLKN